MAAVPASTRLVRLHLCSRARGLCLDVNLSPDGHCNFDCIYCCFERSPEAQAQPVTVPGLLDEVVALVTAATAAPPAESEHQLRQISLSGTGEPTLSPHFLEIVEGLAHLRATRRIPLLKLVLVTNGAGLGLPLVQQGLRLLCAEDEVWVKLDAGEQVWMDRVNRAEVPLAQVLGNIVELGRRRSIVIQSLFPSVDGAGPAPGQIAAYLACLQSLRDRGTRIEQVQIYSASRPAGRTGCGHLPLRVLSEIARAVRTTTGLRAEVY